MLQRKTLHAATKTGSSHTSQSSNIFKWASLTFPDLEEELSVFHHRVWCYLWGLSVYGLYVVIVSFCSVCWMFFLSWRDVEFCQTLFLHQLGWSWVLPFVLLMWCITLIDICVLNHKVHNSFMYYWILLAKILLKIFFKHLLGKAPWFCCCH